MALVSLLVSFLTWAPRDAWGDGRRRASVDAGLNEGPDRRILGGKPRRLARTSGKLAENPPDNALRFCVAGVFHDVRRLCESCSSFESATEVRQLLWKILNGAKWPLDMLS